MAEIAVKELLAFFPLSIGGNSLSSVPSALSSTGGLIKSVLTFHNGSNIWVHE